MVYIAYLPKLRHSTAVTAISADGLRWKLASTDEFTKGHFEITSLVRFNGLYYVAGQNLGRAGGHLPSGLDAGRAMTCFFSPDFRHWSGGRALSFFRNNYTPALESFGQELHMGAAPWNRGNVIVGLYGRWYGDKINRDPDIRKTAMVYDLEIDLGLVVSNDAIHYREPLEDFVVVPPGKGDEWDSHGMLQGQAYHNTETETQIWYSNWYTRNPYPTPPVPGPLNPKPPQIGLLTLRRDGFGYLSKHRTELAQQPGFQRTDTSGSILTKSISLAQGAQAAGECRSGHFGRTVFRLNRRRCRAAFGRVSGGVGYAKRRARTGDVWRAELAGRQEVPCSHPVARRGSQPAVLRVVFAAVGRTVFLLREVPIWLSPLRARASSATVSSWCAISWGARFCRAHGEPRSLYPRRGAGAAGQRSVFC